MPRCHCAVDGERCKEASILVITGARNPAGKILFVCGTHKRELRKRKKVDYIGTDQKVHVMAENR